MEPSTAQLLAENADLRQRLAEAEETLEALRTGAVDALVVYSPGGEQIFTLQGADRTYRHLVENINEGAATLTAVGDILYANGRLAAILDLPLERLIGSTLRDYVAEADLHLYEALFSQGRKGASKGELTLRPANGQRVPAYLSFSSLELEEAPGALSLLVTDLTEQKRQEALVAEGNLSREILLQAQQAIAVCDREGRIIRASRGLHELLGQNPLLLPFHQAIPLKEPSGRKLLLAPLFQAMSRLNVETSFQRPDGRQVQVLFNAGPLVAQDGEISGFVAALTDISERLQAEAQRQALLEKLQAGEAELQALNEELQVQAGELKVANQELLAAKKALEESRQDLQYAQTIGQIGSWRLDVRQNILTWSEENHRIFGIPPGTPLSYETFLACVHPDDREYVHRHWTAALEGEPYDVEHRIVAGDTVKWVRERCELEFDAHGRLLGGFGTTQDISDRKQAEEALRQSEKKYRTLFDSIDEGFCIIKVIFDENGKAIDYLFVEVNPSFVKHTGLINAQGKSIRQLAPKQEEHWFENYGRIALTGEPARFQNRAEQLQRWYDVFAFRVGDPQDRLVAVLFSDITDRQKAEEALRLGHRRLDLLAESANRLLASEDPQAVVDTICPKVMEFLDCDVFFNFIRDDREDRLHLNAWAGIPAEEAERIEWLDYGVAVCGCVALEGSRIVADDIFNTPDPRTELVKSYGIQAYACQPLLAQGRLIGTLSFGTRKKARFNDDDLAMMQAVADQVAVAMERKLFLEALWQSKEQERLRAREMEAILEAVPAPIFLSRDPSGRSVTGNPATYEILQLPPGSNLSLAVPFQERQQYSARKNGQEMRREELPMQRALAGQRVRNLEYDLVLADGQVRHVSANAVPLLDDAGWPRGAVGVITDLTEIKEAQEALRQARDELEERVRERTADLRFSVARLQEEVIERLRAEAELVKQTELVRDLYNQAPCGYHSLDSEGRFVRINDTELAWLGYSREEVEGNMNITDFLTSEGLETFRRNFSDLVADGRISNLEFDLRRKDGTVFPVLLNATAVADAAGNFLMSRSTVYDITERKRTEQALRDSEERLRLLAGQLINAQEQERKRLAAELHDELGHALLTLKLSLGAIARKLPPAYEDIQRLLQDQSDYINNVIEEVRRLYRDLSPGDLEELGLTKALESLIEDFGDLQPKIIWHVDLPELEGYFDLTVQTIIYRLVQEALTNIGKYAEPNYVSISAREKNHSISLVIEDDGLGFDLAEVERDPNRGVGLAAMRERLYLVGGSLDIWSQKGRGTRLTCIIPTLPEAA